MVTDIERDYLWNTYAADQRARINLGIRRRLAPLMERDRRRIELMNALLLTMPGTPVLTVYAPQPIRAVVHVPASRQALVAKAQAVEVKLPDGRWVNPVARTSLPAADPVSQTVEWRLDLAAVDAAGLVPGQQVQVLFVASQAQRLTLPAQAVFRRGVLTAVYVAREGEVTPGAGAFVLRAVRLGASHGTAGHEVLSGLSGNERVALDPVRAGLNGARVGATVQP